MSFLRYSSPIGLLTLASDSEAVTALVVAGQKYEDRHLAGAGREEETPALRQARLWLDAYFSGQPLPPLPPLKPAGTAFQARIWQALLQIPFGETQSYGDLAALLGSSPRAVGSAVGRNPISILIPCHRVLGADGSLTGYAGGLDAKRFLLRLEGHAV